MGPEQKSSWGWGGGTEKGSRAESATSPLLLPELHPPKLFASLSALGYICISMLDVQRAPERDVKKAKEEMTQPYVLER